MPATPDRTTVPDDPSSPMAKPWLSPSLQWLGECIPDIVHLYDTEARLRYLNRVVETDDGPTAEQLLHRTPSEVWGGRDQARGAEFERAIRSVLATGEPASIELPHPTPGGDELVSRVLLRPARSADGDITGVLAIGRDITDLVRAHRELAEREHQYRSLADNLPDIVLRYDLTGRATYVNHQLGEHVNNSADAVLGRRPTECIPPGMTGVEEYERSLMAVLATGEPGSARLHLRDARGEPRIHSVLFRAERDHHGSITGAIAIGRDITDIEIAHEAIAEREREFRTLAENLPDVVMRYDASGRAVYVNRRLGELVDTTGVPLLGHRPSERDLIGPADMAAYERCLMRVLEDGEPGTTVIRRELPSGEPLIQSVLMNAERDGEGNIVGALAIGRDVTEIMQARHEATVRERQFRSLAENATDFIGRWDTEGRRLYVNPALARLHGQEQAAMVGQAVPTGPRGPDTGLEEIDETLRTVIRERREIHRTHLFFDAEYGSERIHDVRWVPEYDSEDHMVSVLAIGRDVTEVVEQQRALELAARTDMLTGVASRQVLYRRLPTMISDRQLDGDRGAILLVDLDGFKAVNDQYGHRLGDQLLCEIAALLDACAGDGDLLVRLGGDEFVLVVSRVETTGDVSRLADRIRTSIAGLGSAEDARLPPLDACVGIAIFPDDGQHIDDLLAHADLALYQAKDAGRGTVEFFRPQLREAMSRRTAIERALRRCDHDTELAVHLQPICTLDDDPEVWGAEALLRWTSPALGPITPSEFIPIAEHSGHIVEIGRWVLRRACAIAVELNRDRSTPLRITVNVSTRQFTVGDVGDAVRDALAATGCDPAWLVIELTESLLLEGLPIVNESLDLLHALGVGLAIDDFGTGFSALEYLTRLRIDHMKIDKGFVHGSEVDRQRGEIARVIVALGEALDIGIVAEGVETVGQADFLRSMGCRLGQGYLLARPMPSAEFGAWLRTSAGSLRAALRADPATGRTRR